MVSNFITKSFHIACKSIVFCVFLTGCGSQKPAHVLLKGEEFYGKRNLESIMEYHLVKENVDGRLVKMHNNGTTHTTGFIMPLNGEILKPRGETCKDGMRIVSHNGTNVVASASGKVIYVGRGLRWYGNMVVIEHQDNCTTVYSYLKSICVKIGDNVIQGQNIGSAGKSSTQDKDPQICFAIHHNGEVVDVLSYIQ